MAPPSTPTVFAQQGLSFSTAACGNNHTGSFITHWHGLIKPRLQCRQDFFRHICLDMVLTNGLCIANVCHTKQQTQIRGIDGRCLHPHDYLRVGWCNNGGFANGQFEVCRWMLRMTVTGGSSLANCSYSLSGNCGEEHRRSDA
jgi:hypothetical protein